MHSSHYFSENLESRSLGTRITTGKTGKEDPKEGGEILDMKNLGKSHIGRVSPKRAETKKKDLEMK